MTKNAGTVPAKYSKHCTCSEQYAGAVPVVLVLSSSFGEFLSCSVPLIPSDLLPHEPEIGDHEYQHGQRCQSGQVRPYQHQAL